MKNYRRFMIALLLTLFVLTAIISVGCDKESESTTSEITTVSAVTTTAATTGANTTTAPATTVAITTAAPVTTVAITTAAPVTTTPTEPVLEAVKGGFTKKTNNVYVASKAASLGVFDTMSFTKGSYSSRIIMTNAGRVGLIFGYNKVEDKESYYFFYANKTSQRVELSQVVDGRTTILYSNYLSAGFNVATEYSFEVIIEDGKAYCYFWDRLYTVQDVTLAGDKVGVFSSVKDARFRSTTVKEDEKHDQYDTIIFGHSYMEMWNNWKGALKSTVNEFDLGTYHNVGIGGSVASHWVKLKEALVAYGATTGIYDIGINDITGGTSPSSVISSMEETLLYIKEHIPEYRVVLLSVSHCPARATIKDKIVETNVLMRELAARYDWILYAEVQDVFCDASGNSLASYFKDNLHPTETAYTEKYIPAIKSALKGENQPTLDSDMLNKLLDEAKTIKYCLINDYSERAYKAAEWEQARPIYNEAAAAIEACKTADEVKALDLSSYIARLSKIKSLTDYIYEDLVGDVGCSKWEVAALTNKINSSTDGAFSLYHDGHRTLNTYQFTDMSFTFKLDDITAEFGTVGILVRARQLDNLGMEGYYINIVTEPNYIQIYYFKNAYGSNVPSADLISKYIGGWVFPEEVEGTEFRAVVKGDKIYIYTEESYITNGPESYGCSADLSYNGTYDVYEQGGIGIMAWSSSTGANGKLVVDKISGIYTEKK